MKKILQNIRQQALKNPHALAIRSGDTAFSYVELIADIDKVAQRLHKSQINRLGVFLDNGIDWIVIDLACAVANVTVVPLPWFFSDKQLEHVIESADIDAVVADKHNSVLSSFDNGASFYNRSFLFRHQHGLAYRISDDFECSKISFTSGTTGAPKSIELTADIIDEVCCSVITMTSDLSIKRHLSLLPYATLLENICGIYVPLMLGKTVFAESAQHLGISASLNINPTSLAKNLIETKAQSLIVTPQLLKLLCRLVEQGVYNPTNLVFVAVGGGHVGTALIKRARNNAIPVYEGYGLTEFASVATLNTPDQCRNGSVGKALPHVLVEIADDGEILLRSKYRPTPCIHTGDLGEIDQHGFVYINGRKKNLLVLSTGRNVSPEWVEAELQGIPEVLQCLVFGEGEAALSAIVIADPAITTESICSEVIRENKRLPAYARIAVLYRVREYFSTGNGLLTETGKPKRAEIIRRLPALLENADATSLTDFVHQSQSPQVKEQTLC